VTVLSRAALAWLMERDLNLSNRDAVSVLQDCRRQQPLAVQKRAVPASQVKDQERAPVEPLQQNVIP
jgi:hypothetical protein